MDKSGRKNILYLKMEDGRNKWLEDGKGKWLKASADGSHDGIYEGETKGGNPFGIGSLICPSGTKYKGHWKNGLKHGKGTDTTNSRRICGTGYNDSGANEQWFFGRQ